jgi:hypothetical protein
MQAFARKCCSTFSTAILILCWISGAYPVSAQTGTTGTITVIVHDLSGAVIPDATLELRDRGTNDVRNGATQQNGAYTFPNLPFGQYQLNVTAKGLQRAVFESVQVQTGRATEIRATMQVGGSTETVQVVADEPPLVETASTVLATTIHETGGGPADSGTQRL